MDTLGQQVLGILKEEASASGMDVREWVVGREGGPFDNDLDQEGIEELMNEEFGGASDEEFDEVISFLKQELGAD